MIDDFEGALNESADVPPTDSELEIGQLESGEGFEDAPDARDDADADEYADRSLNEAEVDVEPERGPIPYERFREVNEKAQFLEQQARHYQEQQAVLQQAVTAGFPTVEAYHAANEWARANNYPNIETFNAAMEEQRQLQAYADHLSARGDLSDEARHELMAARQQQAAINQQMRSLHEQVQYVHGQHLHQAIEQAKAELGPLDPELEQIFRYSSPQIVRQATEALKRQLGQVTDNRVAQYAASKQRQQSMASPEGRGGAAPSAASGPRGAWKKSTFAELIFGNGRTG